MRADAHSLEVGVMVDHHHAVGRQMNVKLAAPETVLLRQTQRGNGILGIA